MNPLKPIDLATLRRQQREASSFYNPVRFLTPDDWKWLSDDAKRGNHPRWQWLCSWIEERYDPLLAVIARRRAALEKLSWNVKVTEGFSDKQAAGQLAEARAFFERIANLEDAYVFLHTAAFRGFAHLSIETDEYGAPVKLEPVFQWHWKRDGLYGPWRYTPTLGGEGLVVSESSFVVRECPHAVNVIAGDCFIKAALTDADYMAGVQDAGVTGVFLKAPPNATQEQMTELEKVAPLALGGMRAVLPALTEVQTTGSASGGTLNIYEDRLKSLERRVILAGTGGVLTMLSEAGGLGNGASNAQDAAFDDLAIGEARHISRCLQRQLLEPWLREMFPGQKIMVYFEIAAQDQADLDKEADRVEKLGRAGFKAKADWVSDRFSIPIQSAVGEVAEVAEGIPGRALETLTNRETPTGGAQPEADARQELTAALFAANVAELTEAARLLEEGADLAAMLPLFENAAIADLPDDLVDTWEGFYAAAVAAGLNFEPAKTA